jgi:hypothetical protein
MCSRFSRLSPSRPSATPACSRTPAVQDLGDIHQDNREIHQDKRDIREDRRDIRQDKRRLENDF